MELLKKPLTAVIVLVLVVLLCTFGGIERSVGQQADKVSDVFNEKFGVGYQLEERRKAALSLAGFGTDIADDESSALRDAASALGEAAAVTDMYAADRQLDVAYKSLVSALAASGTSYNKSAVDSLVATLEGAESAIEKSGYNDAVAEFSDGILGAFPFNVLRPLLTCELPELYGPETVK